MTRKALIVIISVLCVMAALPVHADTLDPAVNAAESILQSYPETDEVTDTEPINDVTDTPTEPPATESTKPKETEKPVTSEKDTSPKTEAPEITDKVTDKTPDPVTVAPPETDPPETSGKTPVTKPKDTVTTDDRNSSRVTTDYRTETESEESETEMTTDTEKKDGPSKKTGFKSPLEVISFILGVPVIISVFAIAMAVARRICYPQKKNKERK